MCATIKCMLKNLSKYIYKLKYFKSIDAFAEIKGGYSGAKTFLVQSGNKKYFVKFRSWKTNKIKYNNKVFSKFACVPTLYKVGKINNIQYFISSYIADSAKHINKLPNYELYSLGKKVAFEQLQISNIHKISNSKKCRVYKKFYFETNKIYKQAIKMFNKNVNNLSPDVANVFSSIFAEIQRNGKEYLELFKSADVFYTHSDFKTDNFFMVDNTLYTVDFEESNFGYLPFYLRAYAYDALTSKAKYSKSWFFAKGIIDGFYKTIPNNFSKQFMAVYYRAVCQKFMANINKPKKLYQMVSNILINESSINNIEQLFNFNEESLTY